MTQITRYDEDPYVGLVGEIMRQDCPTAPREVQLAIANFAQGNNGVARALAGQVRKGNIQTAKELEKIVGWTIEEHTKEKVASIWDKFKT